MSADMTCVLRGYVRRFVRHAVAIGRVVRGGAGATGATGVIGVGVVAGWMMLTPMNRVWAQSGVSPTSSPVSGLVTASDSVPVGSALVSYRRYIDPAQCVSGAERADELYWKRGGKWGRRYTDTRMDTSVLHPAPAVKAMALQCAAVFPVETVAPRYLIDLARLHIIGEEYRRADEIFLARLRHEKNLSLPVQARTLRNIVKAYSAGTGILITGRRPAVYLERIAVYLDSLARLENAETVVEVVEGYVAAVEMIGISEPDPFVHPLFATYVQRVLGLVAKYPTEAVKSAAESMQLPIAFPAIALANRLGGDSAYRYVSASLSRGATDSLILLMLKRSLVRLDTEFKSAYTKAPLIQGTLRTTEDVRPAPGRVTIVAVSPMGDEVSPLNRLKRQFGDSVDLVIVSKTNGFFEDEAPFTPSQEFQLLRRQYQEHFRLDGEVIVSETEYFMRPAPDGRRVNGPNKNDVLRYQTILVDRNGMIRGVYSMNVPTAELQMEAQIRKLLKE